MLVFKNVSLINFMAKPCYWTQHLKEFATILDLVITYLSTVVYCLIIALSQNRSW